MKYFEQKNTAKKRECFKESILCPRKKIHIKFLGILFIDFAIFFMSGYPFFKTGTPFD